MEKQARIVIVGGGIMGVGLLYHLAAEGCDDVLLIEKGELTSGSTWHAAGQCPNLVGNYNLAKIHEYSISLHRRLEQLTGQSVTWHDCGSVRFARTEQDLDWFRYLRGIAANVGYHMEIVDVAKIGKLNPFVSTEGVLAGAWTRNDGHADPFGLTQAMARGARGLGARIVRHNRVTGIEALPGGEWKVMTQQGPVIAETVVNAAGCFARQVAEMVGADLPICNLQHHYLVTGPVPELAGRGEELPVTRDPHASAYLRQEQESGLIGIYESEGLSEAWQPGGLPPWESDSELFEDDLERLMPWLERAMERMPIFETAGIKQHRQRRHLPQPRRSATARACGRTAQFLALLRLVLRHCPGRRLRQVPGSVDVAWRLRNQHDRVRSAPLRGVCRWRLHGRQGTPGLCQDLRHAASGGRTAGGPPMPDEPAVRQAQGPGLRVYRYLWLGAAQVVLARRPRGAIQLSPQQRFRVGARRGAWPCASGSASWTSPDSPSTT